MIKDRKKALAVAQAKEAEENCIAVPYGDFGDRYERDHQYEIAIYSLDSSGNIIKHHEKASGTRIHSLSQDLHLFVISHAQEDKCEPSKAQLWQFYNFSPPAVEEKTKQLEQQQLQLQLKLQLQLQQQLQLQLLPQLNKFYL